MNYFENEPKLILYGGYQMLKLASNTHPRAGDMVSGIKSVNGNWRFILPVQTEQLILSIGSDS